MTFKKKKRKIEPINNWRSCWRFSSLQLATIALVLDTIFIVLAVWNESFPIAPIPYAILRIVFTVLSMGARLIQQRSPGYQGTTPPQPEP